MRITASQFLDPEMRDKTYRVGIMPYSVKPTLHYYMSVLAFEDGRYYGDFGGHKNPKESLEAALVREFSEETGGILLPNVDAILHHPKTIIVRLLVKSGDWSVMVFAPTEILPDVPKLFKRNEEVSGVKRIEADVMRVHHLHHPIKPFCWLLHDLTRMYRTSTS